MTVLDFYPVFLKSSNLVIDSRKVEKDSLFFAFSGETFNAALQANEAINNGALAVIVEDEQYQNEAANIFYVKSTLSFLQELSLHHRNYLNIPIIGLTGSNGKTTTKEIIHAVLSKKFKVQYTFGNLNNHIGVPLSLLSIREFHEIAVIEMGANHQKEIEFLCTLAQPDIGYITNFGKAHLEGFGGVEGIIKGKSELYDYLIHNNQLILINENDAVQIEKTEGYPFTITFGKEKSGYNFNLIRQNTVVGLSYKNDEAISQLTGDYNFTNLCAAASLGLHFGISFNEIKTAIEDYEPKNMRSQILRKNGKILVLDTYNANPSSMEESLKNFVQFEGTKTVIIGDMLELGDNSAQEHQHILNLMKELNLENVICVGEHFQKASSEKSFSDVAELIIYLKENPVETDNILLKGSRGIALEKILDFL